VSLEHGRNESLSTLIPTGRLPDYFHPSQGDELPDGIIGSTIVAFGGGPDRCALEGGGLIIDYRPEGQACTMRAVLKFSELGMWITYSGSHPE
jgi:hypothetical protein